MVTKAKFWLIAVLLIALLGVGVKWLWSGSDVESVQDEIEQRAAMPSIPPRGESAVINTPSSSDARSSNEASQKPPRISMPVDSATPLLRNEYLSTSSSLIHKDVTDPDAVVGQAFPVSASVSSECAKDTGSVSCSDILKLLAGMAQERRDLQWAPEAEMKLLGILTEKFSEYTIRAIECRSTVCAVEVISHQGQLLGEWVSDKWIRGNFWPSDSLLGHEPSPTDLSTTVTVTLKVFERRIPPWTPPK